FRFSVHRARRSVELWGSAARVRCAAPSRRAVTAEDSTADPISHPGAPAGRAWPNIAAPPGHSVDDVGVIRMLGTVRTLDASVNRSGEMDKLWQVMTCIFRGSWVGSVLRPTAASFLRGVGPRA